MIMKFLYHTAARQRHSEGRMTQWLDFEVYHDLTFRNYKRIAILYIISDIYLYYNILSAYCVNTTTAMEMTGSLFR
jgi:hypothetical protein